MIQQKIALPASCFIAVVVLFSCKDVPTKPESIAGNYEYVAYDSMGFPIVRGTLSFTKKDSIHIMGDWSLDTIGTPHNIGPQVGRGELEGSVYHDTTVIINLNPQIADDNVFLSGRVHGIYIKGKWSFSTLVGETNKGTFVARKLLLPL